MGKKQPACLAVGALEGGRRCQGKTTSPLHAPLATAELRAKGPLPLLLPPQPPFSSFKILPPRRYKLALTPHIPENHKSSWAAEPLPPPPRGLCTSSPHPTPHIALRRWGFLCFLRSHTGLQEEDLVQPG